MERNKHIVSRVAIGVSKAHQRQGIARQLFSHAEVLWQAKGIKRVEFTVMSDNHAAIALYQDLGFHIEGIREKSIFRTSGLYIDELYMAKML